MKSVQSQGHLTEDVSSAAVTGQSPPAPFLATPASPTLDAPDASTLPETPSSVVADVLSIAQHPIVSKLKQHRVQLILDPQRTPYIVIYGKGNPRVMKIGSPEMTGWLRAEFRKSGESLTKKQFADFLEELAAEAAISGNRATVWHRVARLSDNHIVIALHDEANTQIHIKPGEYEIVQAGSDILFTRSPASAPMAMPVKGGKVSLLHKYVNLGYEAFTLLIAWLTYTLAHAKFQGNAFVILALIGGQGTGKSQMSKLIMTLVDPTVVGVQHIPSSVRDLAVAAQNTHLLAYDNLRNISPTLSDALCMMATGGALATRRLYTDQEQQVMQLHAALLLNGIYTFVEQPDLAQRTLALRLDPIPEGNRHSETEMMKSFAEDLPAIQGALFELIAKIMVHLPDATVTNPQRMYDFVRWLAAMERAQNAPPGIFQDLYANVVNDSQLDSLMDNSLGAAVLEFAEGLKAEPLSCTPAELLGKLNEMRSISQHRPPRYWPENEIALSKRLAPLQAALMTQGVHVEFKRGKKRKIIITKINADGAQPQQSTNTPEK